MVHPSRKFVSPYGLPIIVSLKKYSRFKKKSCEFCKLFFCFSFKEYLLLEHFFQILYLKLYTEKNILLVTNSLFSCFLYLFQTNYSKLIIDLVQYGNWVD